MSFEKQKDEMLALNLVRKRLFGSRTDDYELGQGFQIFILIWVKNTILYSVVFLIEQILVTKPKLTCCEVKI